MYNLIQRNGRIMTFYETVNAHSHRQYMAHLYNLVEQDLQEIHLDFSHVSRAYSDGMIPILCSLDRLRNKQYNITIQLPQSDRLRRLFVNTNWAHFLCPEKYPQSDVIHDKHLAVQRYRDSREQQKVVNDFLDVVMRTMTLDRRVIAGLEWSINEITDNVLNHANSLDGGLVQVMTNIDKGTVSFTVGDSGRGILEAMKEAFPTMQEDAYAIGEAVKAGVTSRKDYGQGNGLAGTLRIATWSRGWFALTSGAAQLEVIHDGSKNHDGVTSKTYRRSRQQYFGGTLVAATLGINTTFPLEEALGFGQTPHQPTDIIEIKYENETGTEMVLILREETTGFGTRQSGMQIRNKVINLLNANTQKPLVVDWAGIPVISSSFADEFIGKLFLELGPLGFNTRIRNTNVESLVRGLIDKAIKQRIVQQMTEQTYL